MTKTLAKGIQYFYFFWQSTEYLRDDGDILTGQYGGQIKKQM